MKKLTWGNLKASVFAAFKVIATGGSANATLGLGYAATAPTVGGGVGVLRDGAYGLGSSGDPTLIGNINELNSSCMFRYALGSSVGFPTGYGVGIYIHGTDQGSGSPDHMVLP